MRAAQRFPSIAARVIRRFRAVQPHVEPPDDAASADDTCILFSLRDNKEEFDGYLCEVVAWRLGKMPEDDGREIYLGGYWADTPQSAVRWLSRQAVRLARALDPQPGEGWAQGEAAGNLRRLPEELPEDWPDPGQTLREWHTDHEKCQQTLTSLLNGEPFILATRDFDASYTLSARPAVVPRPMSETLHEASRVAA